MSQPHPEEYKGGPPPQQGPPPDYQQYGGQQQGYPPQGQPPPPVGMQPAPQPVVIVQSQMIVGETPVSMQCPYCQAQISTATRYENGLLTWLAVGGLCIFGCWLGCCLIPLCVDACKDVEHTCPNCNRLIGKYQRIK